MPSPAQVCPLSDDTTYIKAFGSADAAVQNTNYSGKRGHGHCLLVGHLVDPLGRVIAVRPGGLLLLLLILLLLLLFNNKLLSCRFLLLALQRVPKKVLPFMKGSMHPVHEACHAPGA